jgi:hypothetical protein
MHALVMPVGDPLHTTARLLGYSTKRSTQYGSSQFAILAILAETLPSSEIAWLRNLSKEPMRM